MQNIYSEDGFNFPKLLIIIMVIVMVTIVVIVYDTTMWKVMGICLKSKMGVNGGRLQ